MTTVMERARRHAALGDPIRLGMVDDLAVSDRSPGELAGRHGLSSNLVAHHLGVLEEAGLVERVRSSGDGRRRYVRLRQEIPLEFGTRIAPPEGLVLFVCTANSARSQLAAAAWSVEIGTPVDSAGTHPVEAVHPGAVTAARRAGLDLSSARPRSLDEVDAEPSLVITVCDRAHEELSPGPPSWHWWIPDPIIDPRSDAFERALSRLQDRMRMIRRSAVDSQSKA